MDKLKTFENFDYNRYYNKQFRLEDRTGKGMRVQLPMKHFVDTWDTSKKDFNQVSLMDFLNDSAAGDFWEDSKNKIFCISE